MGVDDLAPDGGLYESLGVAKLTGGLMLLLQIG